MRRIGGACRLEKRLKQALPDLTKYTEQNIGVQKASGMQPLITPSFKTAGCPNIWRLTGFASLIGLGDTKRGIARAIHMSDNTGTIETSRRKSELHVLLG